MVVVQAITVPANNLLYRWLLKDGALAWAGLPEVDLGFLGRQFATSQWSNQRKLGIDCQGIWSGL